MHTIYRTGTSNSHHGFTLVELAIVMTIIGLLIGGVLKGQEMIQNARVTATIAQVQSYTAALHAFRDRFDNIPGDFPRATTRLPGCSAANYCYNGNGNVIVGTAALPWINTASALITSENVQFWKHLALADLISGVNASASAVTWGQTLPASPLAGGISVLNGIHTTTDTASMDGLQLRLHRCATCGHLERNDDGSGDTNILAISPSNAAAIDRKTDDGRPLTGTTRGAGFGLNAGDPCTASGGVDGLYNEREKRTTCNMYFRLQ